MVAPVFAPAPNVADKLLLLASNFTVLVVAVLFTKRLVALMPRIENETEGDPPAVALIEP